MSFNDAFFNQYRPAINNIKGLQNNIVTDTFSRFEINMTQDMSPVDCYVKKKKKRRSFDAFFITYSFLKGKQQTNQNSTIENKHENENLLEREQNKNKTHFSLKFFHGGETEKSTRLLCDKSKGLPTKSCDGILSHLTMPPWNKQNRKDC